MLERRSRCNRSKPPVPRICISVSNRSYSPVLNALTTSCALIQARHEIPFRSIISTVLRNCIGSSSTTRTRRGSLRLPASGWELSFAGSLVCLSGISTLNSLPLPTWLETESLPPNRFTSPFVMESPSPKPSESKSGAARSKGWKMRCVVFSSIPIPVSLTCTERVPSS